MADKFLNLTAVQTIKTWADGKYALDADLDTLSDRVDDIVAEGGEPNKIDSITFNEISVTPDANKNVALEGAILSVSGDTATVSQPQNTFTVRMLNSAGQPFPNATDLVNFEFETNAYSVPTKDYMEDYVDGNGGKIDKIQVNGTEQTITNKTVNITVPTKVSELQNDGDGTQGSEFATKSYVDQNGGKIDVIKVNGTAQTITNKEVDITVPTKTSDITNDSDFQTSTEVQSAIDTALTSAMNYKGSVATVADLPSTGNKKGDFWNVTATGENYAWDGSAWDLCGNIIDASVLWTSQTGQSNTLEAATVAEINAILNA